MLDRGPPGPVSVLIFDKWISRSKRSHVGWSFEHQGARSTFPSQRDLLRRTIWARFSVVGILKQRRNLLPGSSVFGEGVTWIHMVNTNSCGLPSFAPVACNIH